MARLRAGILGNIRGKVAGVVGSQWKDKNYIREYVKPANPDTVLQQEQRAKMQRCVAFAKPLVGPVFNSYTDRFQKSMSGFNKFIKSNIAIFDSEPDYSLIFLTEGKLSNILVAAAEYTTGTGALSISYAENLGNNGASDDAVYSAAYVTTTGYWYFPAAEDTRDGTPIVITCPTGLTSATIRTYTWAAQYINTLVNLISYSFYKVGEDA